MNPEILLAPLGFLVGIGVKVVYDRIAMEGRMASQNSNIKTLEVYISNFVTKTEFNGFTKLVENEFSHIGEALKELKEEVKGINHGH